MSNQISKPLMSRLLAIAVAGAALVSLTAVAPAEAAKVFVPGQTVGTKDQFGYVSAVKVRNDGEVLVADSYGVSSPQEVRRFGPTNTLEGVATISATGGGSLLNCIALAGNTDFIVNSPWDRPIRRYDENGNEVAYVDGTNMWSYSGFNGKPGPGNTQCVAEAGNYLFAISNRGSGDVISSLSRWNLADLSLGPDTDGPPFSGYLTALATDPDSNAYVTDAGADQLASYNSNLQYRWSAGGSGTAAGQLENPLKIAVSNQLVYVLDNGGLKSFDSRLTVFETQDGSFHETIKLPFANASEITFDQTYGFRPIVSDGDSVYRGDFAIQPVLRIAAKPAKKTSSTTASFRFVSDEPNTRYGCRLDRGKARVCRASTKFRGLSRGRHTLSVFGAAETGIASKVSKYSWTVR